MAGECGARGARSGLRFPSPGPGQVDEHGLPDRGETIRMRHMVIIRFPDSNMKRRALGFLTGRFSFKSWATGEMMLSQEALPALALEGISFTVEGPASYEHYLPAVRVPPPATVQ